MRAPHRECHAEAASAKEKVSDTTSTDALTPCILNYSCSQPLRRQPLCMPSPMAAVCKARTGRMRPNRRAGSRLESDPASQLGARVYRSGNISASLYKAPVARLNRKLNVRYTFSGYHGVAGAETNGTAPARDKYTRAYRTIVSILTLEISTLDENLQKEVP